VASKKIGDESSNSGTSEYGRASLQPNSAAKKMKQTCLCSRNVLSYSTRN
jgi:hypothetical protein